MDLDSLSAPPLASAGNVGTTPASSQFLGVPAEPPSSSNVYALFGPPLAQVMTDEQLETLRRQISVYATICQQLVEMHKATMAQQSAISGSRFGQSSSCDSGLHSLGQRFGSRQRWTPSQTQLQILENLFQQGNGTPSKQRIKEISVELSQYGPISETNVYNWFQNRRARTKRKQQLGASNNADLELEMDIDSHEEKKARTERELPIDNNQHKSSLQKWEQVELHQPNIAESGPQCFQRQATVENLAASYSKADGTGASTRSQLYRVRVKRIAKPGLNCRKVRLG
ncbi:hypothetical protein GOP47_0016690 [Adiantum capillus-veneris]|uniref:Homeobox domain-containing protein n=1 Tax=Adiantum capillus-veneris TaxID=13818 RepID=A0A9D4UI70_ADICA|nr:hypothetical protein GOP47_0016690 [Adiantum capillus-veneris]